MIEETKNNDNDLNGKTRIAKLVFDLEDSDARQELNVILNLPKILSLFHEIYNMCRQVTKYNRQVTLEDFCDEICAEISTIEDLMG